MTTSAIRETALPDSTAATTEDVLKIVDELIHRRFDAVQARFGPEMSAHMSSEQLQQVWITLEMQIGVYTDHGPIQQASHPEYTAFLVPCNFTLHAVELKFVLDHDKRIIGFFVQPPSGSGKT